MLFNLNRYDETSSFLATTSHFRDLRWADTVEQVDVPIIRLDSYCREHGITEIHLIKVDTQGFELEALRGPRTC